MFINHETCFIACVLLATCGGICQGRFVATKLKAGPAVQYTDLLEKESNKTNQGTTYVYPSTKNTSDVKPGTRPRRTIETVTGLKAKPPVSPFKPVTVNPTIIIENEQLITASLTPEHLSTVKQENTKNTLGPEQATLKSHKNRIDKFQVSSTSNVNKGNNLAEPNPCSLSHLYALNVVDCSGISLSTFSPSWFPANTNIILLDGNKLTFIPSFAFSHLHYLLKLSVSGNRISKIKDRDFDGLEKLEYLNLEDNDLNLVHSSYPPDVFDSLRNLKELRLMNNLKKEAGPDHYPDDFLGKLESLEHLTIDSVGDTLCFGSEFGNLTKLSKLEVTGDSGNIDETSFLNVRHITDLILTEISPLINFSETALEPLQKLDSLSLTNVRYGVTKSLLALKPLREKNMTTIYFDRIGSPNQESSTSFVENDGVLDSTKTQFLLEICVKTFTLKASQIYVLKLGSFGGAVWNRCLQSIDLSSNPLVGTRVQLLRILNLKSIQTIILTDEAKYCLELFPDQNSVRKQNYIYRNRFLSSTMQNINFRALKKVPSLVLDSGLFWMTISESLQALTLKLGSNNLDCHARVIGAKSLKYVNLSFSKLKGFSGNITGLEVLQTFMLSGNIMSNLVETFFDNFPSLEILYLSQCALDVDFMAQMSGRLLKNLIFLKTFEVSSNTLNVLASDTFKTNTNLQEVNLSKNRFKTIPFDLVNTPNLKVLDLRENSISTVGTNQRHQLDQLARQDGGLRLLLSGNAISCDCDNLPFLLWMRTTDVQLDPEVTLTCSGKPDDDFFVSNMDDLEAFWRKCNGRFFFSLATSLLLCMTIGFLAVFFVGKYKTFIKSSILQLFTGYRLKGPADYNIGVYIGYSLSDYTFPCFSLTPFIDDDLRLRTFVFHRDMNGSDIASSTVDVINDSWRTVLVFSESFLRDEWATFIYRSAIHSQSVENPSRVVVLVESRLRHRIPAEVSGAVVDDNIIVVSSWAMNYELREQLRTRLL